MFSWFFSPKSAEALWDLWYLGDSSLMISVEILVNIEQNSTQLELEFPSVTFSVQIWKGRLQFKASGFGGWTVLLLNHQSPLGELFSSKGHCCSLQCHSCVQIRQSTVLKAHIWKKNLNTVFSKDFIHHCYYHHHHHCVSLTPELQLDMSF